MSEETAALTVTLKAGSGYDVPWVVVRGDSPDEVVFKLDNLSDVFASAVAAANLFKVIEAGELTPVVAEQATVAQPQLASVPAWGATPQPAAAPVPQAAPASRGGHPVTVHPEGKSCSLDGKPLEYKTSTSGKGKWQCPDWRWNNGTPNGHAMEWIN